VDLTGGLGRLFGPVMLVWFLTAGVLGLIAITHHPDILYALSPHYAVRFFIHHGFEAFRLLGGVVLAVTGGEALYADMGHFGSAPIRRAWHVICLPNLLLCYLGQGAKLLDHPELNEAPFYALCPDGIWRYPFVLLAAMATVIASQALISGVFSLTHQAVRLGYFPRTEVLHTSEEVEGQTYLPFMNWSVAAGCIALVLTFQASAKLAAAFGLAVSGTMAITSIIFYRVTIDRWKWPKWRALLLLCFFLSFDLAFTAANLLKFLDGGFIPLAVGAVFLATMLTWTIGRSLLGAHFAATSQPFDAFLESLDERIKSRVPGTAVYLASLANNTPPALATTAARFGVVHETVILLTVITTDNARVSPSEHIETHSLGHGFYRVVVRYGFFENVNVPVALGAALRQLKLPLSDRLYLLGRETLVASDAGKMSARMERFFAFLSRNSRPMTDHFRLPPDQCLEIGSRVDL